MLQIYPVLLLIITFWGAKPAGKKQFHEDALSLNNAKAIQVFAAFGVMLHHLTQRITHYGEFWKGPITIMVDMGFLFTAVFFFYSGYGLAVSVDSKKDYLKQFLRHRLPTILIPFLITNIIYYIGLGVIGGKAKTVKDAVTSLTGWTLLNGNAWFLVVICILYIGFYLIYRFVKNQTLDLCLMGLVTVGLTVLGLWLLHDKTSIGGHWFRGEWWYNTTIVFYVGLLVGTFREKVWAFAKKSYAILMPLFVILSLGLFALQEFVMHTLGYYQEWPGHPGYSEKLVTLFAQQGAAIAFVLMVVMLSMKIRCRNKALDTLGKMSLEIYLIHAIIMDAIKLFAKVSDPVFYLLTFVFTLIAAFFLKLLDGWLVHIVRGKTDR